MSPRHNFSDPMAQPVNHSIKIKPELDDRIASSCRERGESLTQWVIKACEQRLKREEVPFA